MSPSVLRARSLAGFLGLIAAFALTTVHAQAGCVYNFSEYDNVYPSSDGSTLYYSVSAVDNSGCGHSNYTTTANIQAPDGTVSTSSASGLASTVSTTEDMASGGDYSAYTQGFFYCPYAGTVVNGWGTGFDIFIGRTVTWYGWPLLVGSSCQYSATACTSGTPSCTGGSAVEVGEPPCPYYLRVTYVRFAYKQIVECYPLALQGATQSQSSRSCS